ncbi:MAG: class I SAM-dependent methyltransferase [Chitinophagales bacterium]|nr:class I SAM-dependent methyltransferase [Bacteroidota bacterium]
MKITELFFKPEVKPELNLDDPQTTVHHGEIIRNKKFLRKLYVDWYNFLLNEIPTLPEGKILELGSGGGFLKELLPQAITSDVMPLPGCDLTFSAEEMPFEDESLSAIFMIDVLHHIPRVDLFFAEAQRCLKKGGKIIMSEPANTPWSRYFYQNFHHEPFEPAANSWEIPSTGPLSGANGALPWIVFKRDIAIFQQKYPQLKLVKHKLHTPSRYLLSGGLSYKALVPYWSFGFFTFVEKMTSPLNPLWAMFQLIIVEKK